MYTYHKKTILFLFSFLFFSMTSCYDDEIEVRRLQEDVPVVPGDENEGGNCAEGVSLRSISVNGMRTHFDIVMNERILRISRYDIGFDYRNAANNREGYYLVGGEDDFPILYSFVRSMDLVQKRTGSLENQDYTVVTYYYGSDFIGRIEVEFNDVLIHNYDAICDERGNIIRLVDEETDISLELTYDPDIINPLYHSASLNIFEEFEPALAPILCPNVITQARVFRGGQYVYTKYNAVYDHFNGYPMESLMTIYNEDGEVTHQLNNIYAYNCMD